MKVRPMEVSDLGAVTAIESASFVSPWDEKVFYRQLLNPGRRRLLVVELEGEVSGHLAAWLRSRYAKVTTLAVAPEFRRRGVGTALVKKLIEDQRDLREQIRLEVRKSNLPARKLYGELGFEETGEKEDYYTDNGETAVVMSYNLRHGRKVAANGDTGEPQETA